jgi:hypothetical protein
MVGEGLEESDLSISEWPYFGSSDSNCANGLTSTNERHAKDGTETEPPSRVTAFWILRSFAGQIVYMECLPVKDSTSDDYPAYRRQRGFRGNRAMMGDKAQYASLKLMDCCVIGRAEADSAYRYRSKDLLLVGR